MMTLNDSVSKAFEDLLNSANDNVSSPNTLMGYLNPQLNRPGQSKPKHQSSTNDPSDSALNIFGFCSTKHESLTSSQKDEHDSCKCIKEHIFINDTKNIRITTETSFHFCDLDESAKYCDSSTRIDTYIANSVKRRRSRGRVNKDNKNKPALRLKVNLELWKPAKLEIRLQDIYSSKELLHYIEPPLRYEKGTIVWVKMPGFPSWPAMVDDDPDLTLYYWVLQTNPPKVQYHVVFFDEEHLASRYWCPEKDMRHFCFKPLINFNSFAIFKRFQAGLQQAKVAVTMSVQERLDKFGFAAKLKQPNVILVED